MTERHIRAIGWMVLSVGLMVSSCGSPASPAPTTPAATPATSPTTSSGIPGQSTSTGRSSRHFGTDSFIAPARPLDLTMTPDPSRAATAHLTSAGGSVTATGSDGTTFVLEVPANALGAEVNIVLTPVTTITGWEVAPTGAVAVLMEPDGLRFAVPGRLVITPTASPGDAPSSPFAFHANGADAHLVLRHQDVAGISIPIDHFSGRGFTWNISENFWTTVARYRQREAEDRLNHRIAFELGLIHDYARMGWDEPSDPTAEDIYQAARSEYERDVIGGRLALANESCREAKAAISAYATWNNIIAVMGRPDLALQVPPQLRVLARFVCAEDETRKCFATGDVAKLVSALLADERQNQMAVEGLPISQLAVYVKACGQFDLEIEQDTEGLIGPAEGWDVQADVEITIPLRWEAQASDPFGLLGALEGKAIGKVTAAKGVAGPCKLTFTNFATGDRQYKAKITRLDFIRTGPDHDTARFDDLSLEFTEGHSIISGTMKCPKLKAFGLPAIDVPFAFNDDPTFVITGWTPLSHPKVASKDKSRVISAGTVGIEKLHLTLIHTPGQMPVRPPIQ